jgi:hypothetical protein
MISACLFFISLIFCGLFYRIGQLEEELSGSQAELRTSGENYRALTDKLGTVVNQCCRTPKVDLNRKIIYKN